MSFVPPTFSEDSVLRRGWLYKKGTMNLKARKRWFVLTKSNNLFYFDNESEISLKGIISFASIPVESAHRLVRLSTKESEADNGWFEVVTRKRAWALRSGFKTKDDALAWVRRIREGIRASLGSAVRSPLSHSSALMRSTTSPLLPGFAKPPATSSCDLKTEGSKRIGKIGKGKLTKMESLAQVFKKKKLKKVKSLTSLKLPKSREIGSSSDTRSGIVETSASFEEAPLRLVFLGMSGSGKSTLCLQMRIRDALLRSTFLSDSIGSLVDCMGQSDKHAFDKTMGAIMPSFVADSDSAIATHSTEEYSLSLSEDEEVVAKPRTRGDCLEVDALADLTQSERQIIRDSLLSKTELHKLKKAISVGLLQDMHQLIQECLCLDQLFDDKLGGHCVDATASHCNTRLPAVGVALCLLRGASHALYDVAPVCGAHLRFVRLLLSGTSQRALEKNRRHPFGLRFGTATQSGSVGLAPWSRRRRHRIVVPANNDLRHRPPISV